MLPLKPCGRFRHLTLGSQQFIHVLAEGRIGKRVFDFVARNRL